MKVEVAVLGSPSLGVNNNYGLGGRKATLNLRGKNPAQLGWWWGERKRDRQTDRQRQREREYLGERGGGSRETDREREYWGERERILGRGRERILGRERERILGRERERILGREREYWERERENTGERERILGREREYFSLTWLYVGFTCAVPTGETRSSDGGAISAVPGKTLFVQCPCRVSKVDREVVTLLWRRHGYGGSVHPATPVARCACLSLGVTRPGYWSGDDVVSGRLSDVDDMMIESSHTSPKSLQRHLKKLGCRWWRGGGGCYDPKSTGRPGLGVVSTRLVPHLRL